MGFAKIRAKIKENTLCGNALVRVYSKIAKRPFLVRL